MPDKSKKADPERTRLRRLLAANRPLTLANYLTEIAAATIALQGLVAKKKLPTRHHRRLIEHFEQISNQLNMARHFIDDCQNNKPPA